MRRSTESREIRPTPKEAGETFEEVGGEAAAGRQDRPLHSPRGRSMEKALRSNNLWLTVTYVGLILLMARAYV